MDANVIAAAQWIVKTQSSRIEVTRDRQLFGELEWIIF
jgi:hypothetical protein